MTGIQILASLLEFFGSLPITRSVDREFEHRLTLLFHVRSGIDPPPLHSLPVEWSVERPVYKCLPCMYKVFPVPIGDKRSLIHVAFCHARFLTLILKK